MRLLKKIEEEELRIKREGLILKEKRSKLLKKKRREQRIEIKREKVIIRTLKKFKSKIEKQNKT